MDRSETYHKIKILHLTFDMALGGTEQVIRQLVENMPETEFEHHVFCIDGIIKELGLVLKEQGIEIVCYKRKSGFDWRLIRKLKNRILAHQYQIIHCHQYTPYFYGVCASALTKSKVLFTEHGRFYPEVVKPKRKLINPILAYFTNKITAISKATAQAVIKYEYMPKNKVEVVYNGLRLNKEKLLVNQPSELKQELMIPEDMFVFGTIARLDPIKNHEMMLKAFSRLLKKHNKLFLVIIGDGSMMEQLQQLVSELNIEKNVSLTGFIVEPQKYLLAMDVFLLPSFSEGTSMTLLEAMACGIAPIVTNVGGNPEIVNDGVSGIVINNDNQEQLEQAMLKLYSENELRQHLANQAQLRYQEAFNESVMIAHYRQIYRELSGKEGHLDG